MISDLTNHLWQSTLFVLVVWLAISALRENRAAVRYWLWFAASLKFLVPCSLLVSICRNLRLTSDAIQLPLPVRAVSLAISQVTQPFPVLTSPYPQQQTILDWTSLLFLAVWMCGFGIIMLTRLHCWRRIQRMVDSSRALTLGIAVPAISIRSCKQLLEPSVVGFWHPVLLFPAGLEERLAPAQLEAVVTHELCHVRRRDNLSAAIHMIVEAIFWFHPVVWWMGARLLEERERACDEHVLEILNQPVAYAEAIVEVCKLYIESPLAFVSGVTASNVNKRMEHIVNHRIGAKLDVPRKAALALAAVVALGVPIFVGMMTAPLHAQTLKRAKDPSALIRMKETVLKYALFQMREAIDKYYEKNKHYPGSLDELVSTGYLTQIPADPFTNRTDSWKVLPPKRDAGKSEQKSGVYDVMSGSEATAIDGAKYSTW